jgi:predicted house-cleaning noncanonical NTP pyrophosphatase (MazG superfamily)
MPKDSTRATASARGPRLITKPGFVLEISKDDLLKHREPKSKEMSTQTDLVITRGYSRKEQRAIMDVVLELKQQLASAREKAAEQEEVQRLLLNKLMESVENPKIVYVLE